MALLLLCVACDSERPVTVVASIPGLDGSSSLAPDFALVALPYNRDSLVAAFEARAQSPRPGTDALDSLFASYRAPFVAYTTAIAAAERYSDSLGALKARLEGLARTSPEYSESYARWTTLRDTMRAIDARAAATRAQLNAARPAFVAKSESLRAALRHWQDSTYRGYDRVVDSLVRALHRTPIADTTDASGTAVLQLRCGPWWIYARAWDPNDPNAEWYWNVPVSSDTVYLDATTAVKRPRY
jgi:hypothetical protein